MASIRIYRVQDSTKILSEKPSENSLAFKFELSTMIYPFELLKT